MEKVSIIVPVYNIQNYIQRCLESLINQSYENIEIIAVIDGSIDESEKIVLDIAKNDSRIKVVKKENGGLSSARNEGLKYIEGKFLMYVDGDDWIDKDCIEKCILNFKEDVQVVFFPYIKEYENNSIKTSFFNTNTRFNSEQVKKTIYRRFFGLIKKELSNPEKLEELSTAWGKMYRTDIIKKIEFVDTKKIGTEDAWYNINVFKNVSCAVYIDDTYYHYFKENEQSLTRNYKPELFDRWCNLYTYMEKVIKNEKLSNEFEEALNNRIVINLLLLSLNIINSNLKFNSKIKEIRKLLNQEIYVKAFENFDFKYLGIKWKIFYKACKYRFSFIVIIMTIVAEKIKRYRK